jgi:hypothetical protein
VYDKKGGVNVISFEAEGNVVQARTMATHVRVGRSVGEGGGDLSPGKGEGQQRGDGRETLESSGNHLYSSAL